MKLLVILLSACALALGGIIPRFDDRIIGGEKTTIEKHPYQISLQYGGSHNCGVSIVNKDTIVTAAHCVYGKTFNSQGEEYEVARIIPHPAYLVGAKSNNDIAVMKLARPLTFSDKVQPIELQPAGSSVAEGTKAVVTGWGTTVAGLPAYPTELRVVDVDVITNKLCQERYEGERTITDTMLCAQAPGHDSCQGDSGGPLVANGKLIGVVSWGIGCAHPAYPGVYADVAALYTFVSKYL